MNYIDELAANILDAADTEGWDAIHDDYKPLYRMYALLALAKGRETTRKDVHDAWSAWCAAINADHRSLIPFDQLTPDVQSLDQPYVDAIHQTVRED